MSAAPDLLAMKAAFRRLIDRAGGFEAAEALLGYQKSHLSNAASPQYPVSAPRLDHVLALELHVGEPLVTRLLVGRHGCTMAPLPEAGRNHQRALGLVMREMGEMLALHGAALADGALCHEDLAALRVQAADLARELSGFLGALQAEDHA